MKKYKSSLLEELSAEIHPLEQKKTDAKMILAAKIEDAMKAKGWNRTQLMNATGQKNLSMITKWLSGTHNFTTETLVIIGQALGINLLNIQIEETKPKHYYGFATGEISPKGHHQAGSIIWANLSHSTETISSKVQLPAEA
ncbi:helix-turn-helix domain-containing protein [Jiulongibacter sediminis]|uniref:HTH cro/C1-type domain-containing protein n=1 Tax=Jiulongibacter sediminis TaxID=1605367 RepID=A0A0P7BX04_9BACT|nr:helix-turn-helix transcriptional regulator [Jiulongibacter sediminis]KPM46586.1 hypothetical protein AFM12_19205 [Jiulongibacter sediminis]TBX21159.1 hypothetical protein TK44_19210 [Jiulongibacter sediminis]